MTTEMTMAAKQLRARACLLVVMACVASLGLSACATDDTNEPSGTLSATGTSTGMALTVDIDGGTDVAGVHYRVERVACPGEVDVPAYAQEWREELEDVYLPTDEEPFDALDEDSNHLFADHYEVLDAGCYDVIATPIASDDSESEDCTPARASGVEVVDGQTTEVLLISQCEGVPRGGLDAAAALNHPPMIEALDYNKFPRLCELTTICATASDPNDDPLRFAWQITDPDGRTSTLSPISRTSNGGAVTECVELAPSFDDAYELTVTVHDLFYDENGNEVTAEEWLHDNEDPGAVSHDDLTFPLYPSADVDMFCYDVKFDIIRRLPGVSEPDLGRFCDPITPAEYYCDPANADVSETCPNGQFDPSAVFDICEPADPQQPPCTPTTRDAIAQNSSVDDGTATLVIPAGACPVQVSFTSYSLPTGFIQPFQNQVMYDNVTDVYGPGTYTIDVDLPNCSWQTDLYLGPVIEHLSPWGHPNWLLIAYDFSQGVACGLNLLNP